jgi:hypothetical protein
MFAAQESIRLGAEIDLDQFHRSLLIPDDADGPEAGDGASQEAPEGTHGDAPVKTH